MLDTRLDGKINEDLQQAPTRVCLGLSSQGNGGFTAHWALQWQGIGRGLTILDNGLSKADSIGREFLSNSVRTTSKRTDKGWSTKMDCIATEAKVEAATGVARQIPERLNVAIATIVFIVYMGFFFGVSLLAGRHFWLFALVDLGFLISTPTIWGLVHEGIHGRLLRHPSANRTLSRVLCILLGFSFDAVQFGHLMHHRYNGHKYDRPDRAVEAEPAWKSWTRHWVHLLGGHYLFTALVSIVAFAPMRLRQRVLQGGISGREPDIAAMRHSALKWFSHENRIARIRFDGVAGILLLAFSLLHYAAFWPVAVLAFCGRALLYSTLDNLPHHGVQGRGDKAAKNLSLPAWASLVVLHHNLHRVHHEHPDLPWRAVPAHFVGSSTDGNYCLAAVRQFAGPTRTQSAQSPGDRGTLDISRQSAGSHRSTMNATRTLSRPHIGK